MKISIVVLTVVIGLHSPAEAEVVDYDLPNLHGYYSWAGPTIHRADTLTYYGPTLTVIAVTVNLVGRTTSGLLECCISNFCDTFPWRRVAVSCAVKKVNELGEWNQETTINNSGDLDYLANLSSSDGFDMLNDGDVLVVDLFIQPTGFPSGDCFDIWPPEATIDQARLQLDLEDLSPVKSTSWGSIKALYGIDK